MSEIDRREESPEQADRSESPEDTEGTGKPRGRKGPPLPRGQLARNLGRAARPGFRDPANTRSKASKKGKKKRKR